MKIAITGGAGFIGSHLTKMYLDAGHDVLVIDTLINGSRESVDPRARFYQIDIRDSKLQTVLQRERPDVVSHHALQRGLNALSLEEQALTDADVHIRGLLNVLDSCVAASVGKIIFASGGNSLYRLGSPIEVSLAVATIKEDTPLCPQRPYDISKAAGEWYVRYYTLGYGLTHTIFRYADVYGETNSDLAQHPLSYFVRLLLDGRRPTIRGAADAVRDHICIDDVVSANLCALEYGQNQTLHISSGQGYTLKQLYYAVADLLQTEIEPVYISNALVEPSPCILDNILAQHVLKWRPQIDFTAGVQLAVERLRKQVWQENSVEVARTTHSFAPSLVGAR